MCVKSKHFSDFWGLAAFLDNVGKQYLDYFEVPKNQITQKTQIWDSKTSCLRKKILTDLFVHKQKGDKNLALDKSVQMSFQ